MSIRLGLVSGVARHGIFSALVGPRIMLAPDDGGGTGGGGDGGTSGGDGGASGGQGTGAGSGTGEGVGNVDAGKSGTGDAAKPAAEGEKPKSALAGAVEKAAAKPEGDGGKSPAGNDKVEGADKVKPAAEDGEKKEGENKPKTPEEQAALDAAPKDIDGKPLPEKYEVKMPDGVEMDKDVMALAEPVFREAKLSPAQAQAVTDVYTKITEKQIAAHTEMVQGWHKEAQKDPEIGGKDYEKNLGAAARAFQTFGNERGMQIFDTYGLGNNPDILRIFVRMGKALGEGSTVLPGADHGSVSDAQVMYPSMAAK